MPDCYGRCAFYQTIECILADLRAWIGQEIGNRFDIVVLRDRGRNRFTDTGAARDGAKRALDGRAFDYLKQIFSVRAGEYSRTGRQTVRYVSVVQSVDL